MSKSFKGDAPDLSHAMASSIGNVDTSPILEGLKCPRRNYYGQASIVGQDFDFSLILPSFVTLSWVDDHLGNIPESRRVILYKRLVELGLAKPAGKNVSRKQLIEALLKLLEKPDWALCLRDWTSGANWKRYNNPIIKGIKKYIDVSADIMSDIKDHVEKTDAREEKSSENFIFYLVSYLARSIEPEKVLAIVFLNLSERKIAPNQVQHLISKFPILKPLSNYVIKLETGAKQSITKYIFDSAQDVLACLDNGVDDCQDVVEKFDELIEPATSIVRAMLSETLISLASRLNDARINAEDLGLLNACQYVATRLAEMPVPEEWKAEVVGVRDEGVSILNSIGYSLETHKLDSNSSLNKALSIIAGDPWAAEKIPAVKKVLDALDEAARNLEVSAQAVTEIKKSLANIPVGEINTVMVALQEENERLEEASEEIETCFVQLLDILASREGNDLDLLEDKDALDLEDDVVTSVIDEPDHDLPAKKVEKSATEITNGDNSAGAELAPEQPTVVISPVENGGAPEEALDDHIHEEQASPSALELRETEITELIGRALQTSFPTLAVFAAKSFGDLYPNNGLPFTHKTVLLGVSGLYAACRHEARSSDVLSLIDDNFDYCHDISWMAGPEQRATILLIMAGTLFPAICHAITEQRPGSMLRVLADEERVFGPASGLLHLSEHVLSAAKLTHDLGFEGLSSANLTRVWDQNNKQIREEAKEKIHRKTYSHKPSVDVWNILTTGTSDGFIGKAVDAIIGNNRNALELANAAIERLADPSKLIDDPIKTMKRRKVIVGQYRRSLIKELNSIREFLFRYCEHRETENKTSSDYIIKTNDAFRQKLLDCFSNAAEDLSSGILRTEIEKGAASIFKSVIQRLTDILSGDLPETKPLSTIKRMTGDLSLVPGVVSIGNDLPIASDAQEMLNCFPSLLDTLPDTYEKAYQEGIVDRIEEDRYLAADTLRNTLILSKKLPLGTLASPEQLTALNNARKDIKSSINYTGDQLSLAIAMEIINDNERQEYETKLASINPEDLPRLLHIEEINEILGIEINPVIDIFDAKRILNDINQRLENHFQTETQNQDKVIADLLLAQKISEQDAARLTELLGEKDFITLRESIHYIQEGQKIPTKSDSNNVHAAFSQNFLTKVTKRYKTRRDQFIPDLEAALNGQDNDAAFLIPDGMTDEQKTRALGTLVEWSRSMSRTAGHQESIPHLIEEGLGFTLREPIDFKDGGGRRAGSMMELAISVETVVLPNEFIPPKFGQDARNHFQVDIVSSRGAATSTNSILQRITSKQGVVTPTIILAQTVMLTDDRIALAETCRRNKYGTLVVDSVMMAFLVLRSRNRLTDFFYATLPYIYLNPYVDVDPMAQEMFYGRADAKREVLDLRSSSLIYGGRRFGKSAILLDIARNDHRPEDKFYAVLLNLHSNTTAVPLDSAWRKISVAMGAAGLEIAPRIKTREVLFKNIRNILDSDEQVRILVMIDEADNFIETDEIKHGYENINALIGLMKETDRRFKIVFAGINNVQRMANTPNHSFGFLGTPIGIGPFVSNDDIQEARRLVTEPLAALGYKFQNSLFPLRILAQVHYYPSLIQLYCRQLLKDLQSRPVTNLHSRVITSENIEKAYLQNDLHDQIQTRIALTLQMDDRHRMLAYILANNYHTTVALGGSKIGMTAGAIFNEVASETEIFGEGVTINQIQSLLEEMEHLGLMSRIRENYQFRSVGLVMMLGDQQTVESELINFQPNYPRHSDRTTDRRMLNPDDPFRRSPLDATQEQRLLFDTSARIGVLSGLPVDDFDLLHESISSFDMLEVELVNKKHEKIEHLLTAIRTILTRNTDKTRRVIIISATTGWEASWLLRLNELDVLVNDDQAKILLVANFNQVRDLVTLQSLPGDVIVETVPWWSEKTLESVLGVTGLKPEFSDNEARVEILDACGRMGTRICKVLEKIQTDPTKGKKLISAETKKSGDVKALKDLYGLSREQIWPLRSLIDWCPYEIIDESDLVELFDEVFNRENRPDLSPSEFFNLYRRLGLVDPSQNSINLRPGIAEVLAE